VPDTIFFNFKNPDIFGIYYKSGQGEGAELLLKRRIIFIFSSEILPLFNSLKFVALIQTITTQSLFKR
jgi:hypothetical protein